MKRRSIDWLWSFACVASAGIIFAAGWPVSGQSSTPANETRVPRVSRVLVVVFENASLYEALAAPDFAELARRSAVLMNYHALAHPSQPNYIAMIAGSTLNVRGGPVSLSDEHLGTLLERHHKRWRVYAEDYPGNCFLGDTAGQVYVRRHVPFLSFRDVQEDPTRCANVVNASAFDEDLLKDRLADYSLYVPNNRNNGHDLKERPGVRFASEWFAKRFGSLTAENGPPRDLLLVVTWDEDRGEEWNGNRILTILHGPMVAAGARSDRRYTHYSLLRTIEDALGLGTLGRFDATAQPIDDVWTQPSVPPR